MSRKTITLPDQFLFHTDYEVLYTDVNAASHLGADRVLPIAMEAQLRFIKELGYSDAVAFEDAGLIMAHSEVQYLSEARYGDRLHIELGIRDFDRKSFQFVYRISNTSREQEMARVATTLLFFDYEKSCVIPVPDTFRERCNARL
ncbi:thioesterase [Parahaliea maris]|uniref:Thioesterase n=1 Tax=Parahaliea maris TaxID=2716870 RepID=A0A5C9A5V7_9GAMM|nr:thioesterase family protein [Parahaliea maris]TXS96076.1 thioesterase [Parahaliea maris]